MNQQLRRFCSCPWCPKEQDGSFSMFGQPACKEHSAEEMARVLREKLSGTVKGESRHAAT